MLKIFGHKGNANQNYIEILPHPSQNGYNQLTQTTTQAGEGVRKKEHFYTVGGNVN
jgi:hypothetical protein